MVRIGIDPSINSTGVCIWDYKNNKHIYYLIPSKMTKKMEKFDSDYIILLPYEKDVTKYDEYSKKEAAKFDNIYKVCSLIKYIISHFEVEEVVMEGVSYGSVGSAALVDLSFLNASIRMVLREMNIPFKIVSPTQVKKFACANGQAEKDVMIDAWKRLNPDIYGIKDIKVDDLADAYFLSHYI